MLVSLTYRLFLIQMLNGTLSNLQYYFAEFNLLCLSAAMRMGASYYWVCLLPFGFPPLSYKESFRLQLLLLGSPPPLGLPWGIEEFRFISLPLQIHTGCKGFSLIALAFRFTLRYVGEFQFILLTSPPWVHLEMQREFQLYNFHLGSALGIRRSFSLTTLALGFTLEYKGVSVYNSRLQIHTGCKGSALQLSPSGSP